LMEALQASIDATKGKKRGRKKKASS
jgi:hypothetical protein